MVTTSQDTSRRRYVFFSLAFSCVSHEVCWRDFSSATHSNSVSLSIVLYSPHPVYITSFASNCISWSMMLLSLNRIAFRFSCNFIVRVKSAALLVVVLLHITALHVPNVIHLLQLSLFLRRWQQASWSSPCLSKTSSTTYPRPSTGSWSLKRWSCSPCSPMHPASNSSATTWTWTVCSCGPVTCFIRTRWANGVASVLLRLFVCSDVDQCASSFLCGISN